MKTVIKDQVSGAIVEEINKKRILTEISKLNIQDKALSKALEEMNIVREFIGKPENILGSEKTKHGEIAEQVEVGITRAKDILNRENPSATFEGVGRTAPEDYLKNGIKVQSKFINGTNNNLNSVLKHMETYENFGRDGSFYEIPKDTHEIIEKIIKGEEVKGLKESSKKVILEKVKKIEEESGKSYFEVVRPGSSKYSEVQQGRVEKTITKHEKDLKNENKIKKADINKEYRPSLNEGLKATGAAALVGAGMSLTVSLYKNRQKLFKGELTTEEWSEIGVTTVKDGGIAGVTGGAIYGLTNYAGMSAPFAAAIVSATKGVSSLVNDYLKGDINEDDLTELGIIVCSETAIVGLTTAVGQTIIPIPILGAVIGAIAGSILNNILNFNKKSGTTIEKEMNIAMEKLDKDYKFMLLRIEKQFEALGDLLSAAFSVENNLQLLEESMKVAYAFGVEKEKIICTTDELDDFMRN